MAGVNRLPAATTGLYQPTGNYVVTGARSIDIQAAGAITGAQQAAQFRPGDWVDLGAAGARLQIVSISGVSLRLAADLNAAVWGKWRYLVLQMRQQTPKTYRIVSTSRSFHQEVLRYRREFWFQEQFLPSARVPERIHRPPPK